MSSNNQLTNFDDSEDEDDNFNPAPAELSDDENANDDDAPEDQAQNEVASRTMTTEKEEYEADEEEDAPGNTKADVGNEDEDEEGEGIETGIAGDDDEEEDDEEDEDDEEEVQGHRSKRRRRDKRNQFLDVEAEVDEDEDEVDEDEDELNELKDNFIADTHPDDLADLPAGGDTDDRGHREVDRMREREMHMDAEKQAEMLKRKYAKSRSAHATADSAVIPKRLLLPSVQDPSIWAVKCKEGKEKEAIFAIMKRIEERWGTRDELAITAAFERGGPNAPMKGHIYVEARSQADILKALDGIMNVYPRTKMHLVEIKEMPDLLRVTKTETLENGTYVRIRKPALYAGDLAQICDITENGLEFRIRLVPRLDYGLSEEINASGEKRKRPGVSARPPPRLFSEVEARKRHARFLSGNPQTKQFMYKGDEYNNGFLEKDAKLQNLITKDVNPTLEEVTRFASGGEDGTENLDLNALAASLKASTASTHYLPGDIIEVYEGEQKGLSGKAVTVQSDIVTLAVTEGALKGQSIEVPIKGLRKKFAEGDHVKVIGGSRFRDEVGMVVAIVDDRVTLLSDQNHSEITVFSKDLREASDSGGAGSLGQYNLFDLVQLDPATVACIVKIDRESMIVLDQNSQVRTVMPTQISNKIDKKKHAAAADRNGNEIRIDDSVKEYGGEGKVGKIIHIHRSYLFLHTLEQNENAGVFVARITGVTSMSAKGARGPAGPDLTAMNPALQRHGGGATLMPPPKIPLHRDRSIGQTVTIRKGPYKGLLGIVKDATDTHVRVELHTKAKTVNVPRETVAFKDKYTGVAIDPNSRGGRGGGRGGRGGFGGATPGGWEGGRTPMVAGLSDRTPAWGSRTPAHTMTNGGRTPAWQQAGGRTPAWQDGSRTVIPGDRTSYGGRTPAWASGGSKTPAYDGFGLGSKTPAYGGGDSWGAKTPAHPGGGDSWGAKTPAHPGSGGDSYNYTSNVGRSNTENASNSWGSNANSSAAAPTPNANSGSGAYDAPTPAAGGQSAPTPSAMNAPTPGAYSAPTPAASAPTPAATGWGDYGGSAPTPGASGLAAPTPGASWGGGGYVGAPTPVGYGQAETPAAWGGNDGDVGYADE